MNWKLWLKSLAAVAIGGGASGAATALQFGQVGTGTAVAAGVGALSTVLAYLMRSPLGPPPAPAGEASLTTTAQ